MKSITFHITRAEDGHYVATALEYNITTTAMTFDKLIRNVEEALAVLTPTSVDVELPYRLIYDSTCIIPGL